MRLNFKSHRSTQGCTEVSCSRYILAIDIGRQSLWPIFAQCLYIYNQGSFCKCKNDPFSRIITYYSYKKMLKDLIIKEDFKR